MLAVNKYTVILGVLVACGLAGALVKIIYGEHVLGTTDMVPWGMLIAGYVFFAASATGVGLIGSLAHVFGYHSWDALGKRPLFLAAALLLPGFGLIGIELGNPFHMIWILFSPNLSSGIWWMGSLYSIYLALLIAECYFSQTNPHHKNEKLISTLSFLTKIAAVSNLGAIFAFLHARPFWQGGLYPVLMIVTAVLSGAACLIIVTHLLDRFGYHSDGLNVLEHLGRLLALLLAVTLIFDIWKMYTGMYGQAPGLYEATMALLVGPLSLTFWLCEIGAGIILPLILLLGMGGLQNRQLTFYAAVLALGGMFFQRYNFVIAGQIAPQHVVGNMQPFFHSYSPSWVEWALVLAAFAGAALLYLLCEQKFDLDKDEAGAVYPRRWAGFKAGFRA